MLILVMMFLMAPLSSLVNSFNIDVNMPLYKKPNSKSKPSYFGYSVAQHYVKAKNVYYILVGAPKDTYESYNNSGAVYKCPLSVDTNDCTLLNVNFMPKSSSDEFVDGVHRDSKLKEQYIGIITENQWFGITVSSVGDGSFAACAHKYAHYYNFTVFDQYSTYGACFLFNNDFNQAFKFVPCLEYAHEISAKVGSTSFTFNYGFCQAGTSLSMNKEHITIGMPGSLNYRGLVNLKEGSSYDRNYVYKNQRLCIVDSPSEILLGQGYCPRIWPAFSYTGMSTSVIETRDNKKIIVSGSPRYGLNGAIQTFQPSVSAFGAYLKLNQTIYGYFKTSYFGYSITTVDVNGDGLKDVIVGAPFYSEKYNPNKGAVYIYLNNGNSLNQNYIFNYTGPIRSQFGLSISSIGDIDGDSFEDFAVGAPYELNDDGMSTGALYIFRGSKDAAKIKLSQIIYASELGQIKSFASSISGGMDLDLNGYPDIVVGSYLDESVHILRTYPIVKVNVYLKNEETLQEIDYTRCKSSVNGICFQMNLCFNLIKSKLKPILNFRLSLAYKNESRVYLKLNQTNYESTIDTTKGDLCEIIDVYLNLKEDFDNINTITFNLTFLDKRPNKKRVFSLNDINSYPITHEDYNFKLFKVNFKKECGFDKKCNSDVALKANFLNISYDDNEMGLINIKESDILMVKIDYDNTLENAEAVYGAEVHVDFDKRLDYIRSEGLNDEGYSCKLNAQGSLNCKLTVGFSGSPFEANKTIQFILKFNAQRLSNEFSSDEYIRIHLSAKSLNNDPDLINNNQTLVGKLVIRADLVLYGQASPEQVFYSDRIIGESAIANYDSIGQIIEHTYTISNLGPYTVSKFNMKYYWPFETQLPIDYGNKHGKHLLYLTDRPIKIPNDHLIELKCDLLPSMVDPINQKLKREIESQNNENKAVIDCFNGKARCHEINCEFDGEFKKSDIISVKFKARLWNSTLSEDYSNIEKVLIRSNGQIYLNNTIVNDEKQINNEISITTIAYSQITKTVQKKISIWIYILSIVAALIILALSVTIFWMLGFFERKKFEEYIEEAEKLNRFSD